VIRSLKIKNLALIESAEISFEKGLHIITGETGSGKTLLLSALALILGKRAQSNLVRQEAEKVVLEATFEIPSSLHTILIEAGIDCSQDEELIIRREISKEGKSRAQINCQTVPLPFLQKVGSFLCDMIDQSSQYELKQTESQRELLDLFADLHDEVHAFSQSWKQEKELQEKLQSLLEQSQRREKECEFLTFRLQEIQDAKFHEEESIASEYNFLSQKQEVLEKVHALHTTLSGSLLGALARLRNPLEQVSKIDPSLSSTPELFQEAQVALREVESLLGQSLENKEADPKRLSFLEERISQMHDLKRKLQKNTFEEISNYEQELQGKLQSFSQLDEEIETSKKTLDLLQKDNHKRAKKISEARKKAALKWQKELTESLHFLNMPHAELHIEVKASERSQTGDDLVTILIRANQGSNLTPLQSTASGGEISRLFLAIRTSLAEKNRTPLLIFDEIDANVGGETATRIGQNLQKLAQTKQLLCVTHFPQVAHFATHHFRIQKNEAEGKTTTTICALSEDERSEELLRMSGGSLV
jgi:DNA repair protein RecN (Recombination protein N)